MVSRLVGCVDDAFFAGRLVITLGMVTKHLEHIYMKVDVHSWTAAVARGRRLKVFL